MLADAAKSVRKIKTVNNSNEVEIKTTLTRAIGLMVTVIFSILFLYSHLEAFIENKNILYGILGVSALMLLSLEHKGSQYIVGFYNSHLYARVDKVAKIAVSALVMAVVIRIILSALDMSGIVQTTSWIESKAVEVMTKSDPRFKSRRAEIQAGAIEKAYYQAEMKDYRADKQTQLELYESAVADCNTMPRNYVTKKRQCREKAKKSYNDALASISKPILKEQSGGLSKTDTIDTKTLNSIRSEKEASVASWAKFIPYILVLIAFLTGVVMTQIDIFMRWREIARQLNENFQLREELLRRSEDLREKDVIKAKEESQIIKDKKEERAKEENRLTNATLAKDVLSIARVAAEEEKEANTEKDKLLAFVNGTDIVDAEIEPSNRQIAPASKAAFVGTGVKWKTSLKKPVAEFDFDLGVYDGSTSRH